MYDFNIYQRSPNSWEEVGWGWGGGGTLLVRNKFNKQAVRVINQADRLTAVETKTSIQAVPQLTRHPPPPYQNQKCKQSMVKR